MTRKISSYLDEFYSNHTTPALLVTGARQIGKSFAIREFGKRKFKHFVEINFIETPSAIESVSTARSTDELLLRITAISRQKMEKGSTLIFLDEIQKVPEIVTVIKFLVQEASYRYVLSGSLLGVELKNIRSVPVGYMAIKEMYPLDLEEFFEACGVQRQIFTKLEECFKNESPVDETVHAKLMELFRLYLIVGGMPAAVQAYLDTNNIQDVIAVQKSILRLYRMDISQYDPENKLYIEDIFDLIPSELNAQNKRFILKKLNENLKFNRYEDSFIWMREAGVALPTYNVETPTLPLELAKVRNLFKLFSNDVGLLACQYAQGIQLRILNNEAGVNFGAVYENAVAQELRSHGIQLYYFNSKKQGELDFVIKCDDRVLPIEVKSGKNYERHNALRNVLASEEYGIQKACVLYNGNVQVKGKASYLPVYMVMFIKDTELPRLVYKVDLSGLG
ncbi:MAG: ATP-binding protein [Treponema sp.]|nr:ATP-binding protein [Treponema sp.]